MSENHVYINGTIEENSMAWCMSKIDEFTKVS